MELKLAHTTRQTLFQFGHDSTWYQFILTQMTLGKYIIHSQCLASYVPVSHRDQKNCRLADKFIVKQTCKEQSKNFVNFAPAILEKTSLFIVVV